DGQAHRVTEIAASTNSAVVSPTWSPDGKHLAFATVVDPSSDVKAKSHGQQDVWTVNADGSNRHRVTDGNGLNISPVWGVDNRIYFVSDRGGSENIWSTQVETFTALSGDAPVAKNTVHEQPHATETKHTAAVETKAADEHGQQQTAKSESHETKSAVGAT